MEITELLKLVQVQGASDLHLVVGSPPMLRIQGGLVPVEGMSPLDKQELHDMIYDLLLDEQRRRFEEDLEMDFAVSLEGVGRFRANIFYELRGQSVALRAIPDEIKPMMEKYGKVYQAPLAHCDRARKELGLETHNIKDTLRQTGQTMIDLGLVKPAWK